MGTQESPSSLAAAREIRDSVVRHLVERLDAIVVHDDPWPHFYLEPAFPEEIYARMLREFPDPEHYSPDNLRVHVRPDGSSTRDSFVLDPKNLSKLDEDRRALWSGIEGALGAPELKQAVFRALRAPLARRFRIPPEETKDLFAWARPTLMRESSGTAIWPHPDTRSKTVTMLFYLPKDSSQANLGTWLYRQQWLKPSVLWAPRSRFEKRKQLEFRKNSCYAFVPYRNTWHGRDAIPEDSGIRNVILHFYYNERAKK